MIIKFLEREETFCWLFVSTVMALILVILIFCVVRIYTYNRSSNCEVKSVCETMGIAKKFYHRPYEITQTIVELFICNACIITISYIYMKLVEICQKEMFKFLSDYLGLILLFMVAIGILINNLIDDRLEQNLNYLPDRKTLRLISSVSVLVIFLFARYIYKSNEYEQMLIAYIGLVLGRFIYFDTSREQMKDIWKDFVKYWWGPIIVLVLTAFYYILGVKMGALDGENFMESILLCHLSLLFVINITKNIIKDMF